tara:strand:- start:9015 stop:10169 length:1155 start_codon:yes stop_codon:yes gene_type:complete
MKRTIGILGSTGSIGINTIDVIRHFKNQFSVKYLSAYSNNHLLLQQIKEFNPDAIAIVDQEAAKSLRKDLNDGSVEVLEGRDGLLELSAWDNVDICLNAIVGGSGMEPTIKALQAGVNVALSNKESLVMAGSLIKEVLKKNGTKIFPVDSEHSAIWQCLMGEENSSIKRIILTGSGGPFRSTPKVDLIKATIEEALAHPNWNMGSKISIDSATMMNKGFEVIEAYWLFGLSYKQIEIVIHPQSIIHSMVEFIDGSVKAQLGLPDMKVPIQMALTFPNRFDSNWKEFNPTELTDLTFEKPNFDKFPCLNLAYESLKMGGSAAAALNIANDKSVQLFLDGRIGFTQIAEINEAVLREHKWISIPSLSYLIELEEWGKTFIEKLIKE